MVNRIINGAMMIDQRNAGASVTPTDGQYTLDRWIAYRSQALKYSIQQNAGSVTPPVGFNNYLGATSLSAYSVVSGDYFAIQQRVEGFNFADMGWGNANAKTVTLSFQVYSSLTGTFGGALLNSADNRSYPFSYTVSSANTWTTISLTIAGDTTGTWVGATNGTGVKVTFSLGCGSTFSGTANSWQTGAYFQPTGATSVVGTSGATFYITGVQLEKGSVATSFDYRPYGTELALCQRYCWVWSATSGYSWFAMGSWVTTTRVLALAKFPVPMRGVPSATYPTPSTLAVTNVAGSAVSATAVSNSWLNNEYAGINVDVGAPTAVAGQSSFLGVNNTPTSIVFSAEL
jgi:hypothetical protein